MDESLSLRDLGVSAFRGKNAETGALGAFLDAVSAGKVASGSILIIESIDRLTRNKLKEALPLWMNILKSGITIATLDPERLYTEASLDDIAGLIEPLIIMARSNEESERKASLGKQAWIQKRQKNGKVKLTARAPAWLDTLPDRSGFRVIAERAEVVKNIFRWSIDGMGNDLITKKLNAEFPTIGQRAATWHESYVAKILRTRAVLGEYQPHTRTNNKRVPVGEVWTDYFPRIISDKVWYQARAAIDKRRNQQGPIGKRVANLFTGLLFDARDKEPMNILNKGDKTPHDRLVSSGAVRGVKGSKFVSFPYHVFESHFLYFLKELKVSDVVDNPSSTEDDIATLSGRLVELNTKIELLQKRIVDDTSIDALIGALALVEKEKKSVAARLEECKKTTVDSAAETVGEIHSLVLGTMKGEEVFTYRLKLKAAIRRLVKEVWAVAWRQKVHGKRKGRFAHLLMMNVQVHLHSGQSFYFFVRGDGVGGKPQMMRTDEMPPAIDLRNYSGWHDATAETLPDDIELPKDCPPFTMEWRVPVL